ncbi:hypothetical protein pEaSNUABM12_00154 [Erwinia phage pEa_SNUABM_12]|uniref:Uncharacterized protein n=1 Tax=Erwinia phage pEa_SNUABM_12 TaxID=2768773 RepID=A0A7L8ZLQ4_9CAUD|nr:hypothetical protein pEaSNUABM12_00154 [Erwinia phage pEa_SNUABM_12]
MNLLEQFKTAQAVYLGLINEHGSDIIVELLNDIQSRHPKFNATTIVGYTPEWNDGEACEHSSDICVSYLSDDILDKLTDMTELLGEDFELNDMSREEARDIEKQLNLADVILQEIYGTNYQLGAIFVDGTFKLFHSEYECGY